MKMTSKEIERILEHLTTGHIASFGKTVITVSNYNNTDKNRISSYFSIFDYDTPICTISAMTENGKFEYTGFTCEGWKYSVTTTKHTRQAILLVLMVIQIRFDECIPYDDIMEILNNRYPTQFMGF